jgi:hypothetical protein
MNYPIILILSLLWGAPAIAANTRPQQSAENDSTSVILEEVEISANSIIHVNGTIILHPSKSDVRASSTTISLFQKLHLPGLEANPINRSISVDGGIPMILINGIPSSMDDVNALKPADIAKIEFSRVTPARYTDKGNTGFLSIHLKKRDDGGQVYAWGRSALTTTFVDANIRSSYHQGPSQFTLMYSPSWRNYHDVYDNYDARFIGNDFTINLEEHDRNPFNYTTHAMKLKYDYSPDVRTLLSVTFTATPSNDKSHVIGHTKDSWLGEYDNDNLTKSHAFSPSLDLFFCRDFNEKNSLEAQIVGTLSSSNYNRDNSYLFSDNSVDNYIMNVDSRRRSLISEVSYIHLFSNITSLAAGYQNTLSHSTNTYLTSDYKPTLTENNNYIYVKLGQQVGKVYFSIATGAKLFWIRNDITKRHFIRNLSSAQLSWNISRKWNLGAAFQYSPSIPSLTALTDYPQQQTPYLLSNGNPNLKVSDNFQFQLMPSYQHKKFSASLLLNYLYIKDFVMGEISYLDERLFMSQSVNADKFLKAGADLNLKLSGIHGFGGSLNIGLDYYETTTRANHYLTSFHGSFMIWWNKGPYTLSYWRKIPGKYLNGDYVGKDENGDALKFEFQPNKHWTFEASWMYMFDKKGTKYPGWNYSPINPSFKERYIKDNGNMIVLSVSYSADFGTIFRTVRRSLNNTDNTASILKL